MAFYMSNKESVGRFVVSAVPSQSGTLTYDGTEQTPTWSDYDTDKLVISGETAATNAGNHTAFFTPKRDYKWSDNSIGPKAVVWTIGKAAASATFSSDSVTLTNNAPTATVTVESATGAITAVSSGDTDVATVSLSGSTITITGASGGTTSITVDIAEGTNNLSGSATISVTSRIASLVSWATGTDEEIAAMVQAYYDGTFSLQDIQSVWNVGDEREVSLSAMAATGVGESHVAQTVKFVIMNFGGKKLASDGTTDVLAIVGQKNLLANGTSGEGGYMNSSNTNNGGWNSCARRTWCNSVYKNAVPETLRAIFKEFNNVTANGSSTTTATSADYFALPSEKEVFGSTTYANATAEASNSQFSYYATSANRIKKYGDSGSAYYWWERSPYSDDSYLFCYVSSGGDANGNNASNAFGLAPFGCI